MDESSANQSSNRIVVSALKYDGTEHKHWPGWLAVNEPPLLIVEAVFSEEVQHDLLGTINKGTISREFYWLDRWYNIFRFGDTHATYYCNVTLPPHLENTTLSYVDLDIDIFVKPDFTYDVLDLEDFQKNARVYSYSKEVERNARQAVEDLITLIDKRAFPFDR